MVLVYNQNGAGVQQNYHGAGVQQKWCWCATEMKKHPNYNLGLTAKLKAQHVCLNHIAYLEPS